VETVVHRARLTAATEAQELLETAVMHWVETALLAVQEAMP